METYKFTEDYTLRGTSFKDPGKTIVIKKFKKGDTIKGLKTKLSLSGVKTKSALKIRMNGQFYNIPIEGNLKEQEGIVPGMDMDIERNDVLIVAALLVSAFIISGFKKKSK